ncbi:hypothetical protein M0R45_014850 [Rubus argutus]|uniref:Uncharacterized protein n=1 Tax=Rubus argutus TaxID=59490 RepID=A0AAW1XNR0_RUBAR
MSGGAAIGSWARVGSECGLQRRLLWSAVLVMGAMVIRETTSSGDAEGDCNCLIGGDDELEPWYCELSELKWSGAGGTAGHCNDGSVIESLRLVAMIGEVMAAGSDWIMFAVSLRNQICKRVH